MSTYQINRVCKSSSTILTNVILLSRMDIFMYFQIPLSQKRFPANIAHIPLQIGVFLIDVLFIIFETINHCGTKQTLLRIRNDCPLGFLAVPEPPMHSRVLLFLKFVCALLAAIQESADCVIVCVGAVFGGDFFFAGFAYSAEVLEEF